MENGEEGSYIFPPFIAGKEAIRLKEFCFLSRWQADAEPGFDSSGGGCVWHGLRKCKVLKCKGGYIDAALRKDSMRVEVGLFGCFGAEYRVEQGRTGEEKGGFFVEERALGYDRY